MPTFDRPSATAGDPSQGDPQRASKPHRMRLPSRLSRTNTALSAGLVLVGAVFGANAQAEEPSEKRHRFGPHFKASSNEKSAQDISKNAYGAYSYAPQAPKIGDRLANIHLPAIGEDFDLDTAKKKGPVVIVFYRGFW